MPKKKKKTKQGRQKLHFDQTVMDPQCQVHGDAKNVRVVERLVIALLLIQLVINKTACFVTGYVINTWKTAINKVFFIMGRVLCARESRLPGTSISLLLNRQGLDCSWDPLYTSDTMDKREKSSVDVIKIQKWVGE